MPGEEIIFVILSGVLALLVMVLVWVTFTGGRIPWILFKSKLFRGKGVYMFIVGRGGAIHFDYGKLPKHNIFSFGKGTNASTTYIQRTRHYIGGTPCYILIEGETTNPNLVDEYGLPYIERIEKALKEKKLTSINLNDFFPFKQDSRLANQATVMSYNQGRIDAQYNMLGKDKLNWLLIGCCIIVIIVSFVVMLLVTQNGEKILELAKHVSPAAEEAVKKAGSFIVPG